MSVIASEAFRLLLPGVWCIKSFYWLLRYLVRMGAFSITPLKLKTLESPLDCKEIKLVNLKGNQSWIFIGRTDAEAEAPILGPPDAKSQLIGKDPDAGKDWGQNLKVQITMVFTKSSGLWVQKTKIKSGCSNSPELLHYSSCISVHIHTNPPPHPHIVRLIGEVGGRGWDG